MPFLRESDLSNILESSDLHLDEEAPFEEAYRKWFEQGDAQSEEEERAFLTQLLADQAAVDLANAQLPRREASFLFG